MEVAVGQRQSAAGPEGDVSAHLERRLRALAIGLAGYTLLGGLTSFAGWAFDLRRLTDWVDSGVSIQPNTTLVVTCAGAGLLLLARRRLRGAQILGGVIILIGGLTLLEWITGLDFGIDSLFMFGRTWGRVGVIVPGRMGPPGALSSTLIGTTLLLAARGGRGRAMVPYLAGLTMGTSLLSIIGYVFDSNVLYTLPRLTVIAFQTSTFVMASSLALVFNLRERAPAKWLTDPGPVGILVRRAAPLLVLLPIALGSLGLLGNRYGVYDLSFGVALRTVVEIALLLGLLWWSARAVDRQVARAAEQERAVRVGDRRFRSIFENVAVSLWEEDFSGVVAALDDLKRKGVKDFQAYFEAHPEFVQRALGLVRVLDVNDASLTLFQAGSREELLGRPSDILWPDSAKVLAGMLTAVAEGKPRFESEASVRTLRGERLYVFFSMVLPPSEASRELALFSVFDLTERRHHELERARLLQSERQAREEAERASQVKDEFLATLSHELRTPLNAILGWVRILEKRPDDPATATEAIDVISRNARAQAALIADLLDMNRIMSGKIRLDLHDVPLDDAVAQAIEAIRPAADAKQVTLQAEIDHGTGAVRADASRLQQVLWNLLSNALKFTPKGGRIDVRLVPVDGQAEIAVADSGAGISEKFLPYVFDRFRQADSSTTREHGGLGLGLAIVKNLVDLHRGTVRAESAGEGRGATFTLRLPLGEAPLLAAHHPPGTVEEEEAGAATAPPPEEVDLDGVTVLAVDDQEDARDLLKVVLERCHARVLTAASADEALRVLESARPDIVLCDIGMPGKDGYSFIREVRHREDPTPALAVTAFAHKEDRIRALRAGYQGQIAKPVEPAELVSAVAAFVRTAAAARSDRKRNA
ncbi:MAG TPA: ATP-binding protein [Candidatus Polarisedimenticolia bacterium]|nr:ATP-binding protein [Candidatus Polarisedimenticolia bacterium]